MEMIRRLLQNSWIVVLVTSPRIQRYLHNASWLIFEKFFSLFIALIVNIYVARYLKPEGFGLLNYSLSFVAIFSAFTSLGLDQILLRELSKSPSLRERILGTGFILKLCGTISLVALMLVILPFMGNDSRTNALIIVIAAAELFRVFEIINLHFQSQVLSKHVVQVQLVVNLAGNLMKIALVLFGAPLIWFAWMVFINAMGNAVGYIYKYRSKTGSIFRWIWERKLSLKFLGESWPVAIQSLALFTQLRIDQVMLGKLVSISEVAQYSVAVRFIDIFSLLPGVVINTFIPAITRGKELGADIYRNRLTNLYRLMFIMFLAIGIPTFLFAEDVVVMLYGVEYQAAGFLLSMLVIRLLFVNLGLAKLLFMVNEGLFKFGMITTILGAILSIALNYVLIPRYGAVGAIMANIVSFTVSEYVIELFYYKTRANLKLIFQGVFSFWKINAVLAKPA